MWQSNSVLVTVHIFAFFLPSFDLALVFFSFVFARMCERGGACDEEYIGLKVGERKGLYMGIGRKMKGSSMF